MQINVKFVRRITVRETINENDDISTLSYIQNSMKNFLDKYLKFKATNFRLSLLLFASFLLISFISSSQNEIKGVVVDKSTKTKIPFSSVFLKNNAFGASTNNEGKFTLEIDVVKNEKDTLIVRCFGYEEKRIPIILTQQNMVLNISLIPDVTLFDEVDVIFSGKNEAREILKKVRKAIRKNYIKSTTYYDGFYREILLENEIASKLNEASFQLQYSGYPESRLSKKAWRNYFDDFFGSSNYKPNPNLSYFAQHFPVYIDDENEVNIVESRVSLNRGSSDGRINVLGDPLGGPIDLVGMDNLKFQLHFFNKKLEDSYAYGLTEDVLIEDTIQCYVIHFKPKQTADCYHHNWSKKIDYPAYEGEIFISKTDYSVVLFNCKSVNWEKVTTLCSDQSKLHPARKYRAPISINYSVSYQKTFLGWTLQSVNYKSRNETEKGIFSWERELTLSGPKEESKPILKKNVFPIIRESLRYGTASYDDSYWEQFKNGELYFALDQKYKNDLEKELPLENQFELLNQSIETIPKPKINKRFYDSITSLEKQAIYNDVKRSDLYSSTVLQKMVNDEKKFVRQMRQVLNFDEPIEETPQQELTRYKIDYDSLFQQHYYELQVDSSYQSIFNISNESQKDYSQEIGKIDVTEHFVVFTKESKMDYHKVLKVKPKGNSTLIDSISNISNYNIIDDSTILYTTVSSTGRSNKVILYQIGANTTDKVLLTEKDVNYEIELFNTASNEFSILSLASKDDNRLFGFNKKEKTMFAIPYQNEKTLKSVNHFSEHVFYVLEGGKKLYQLKLEQGEFFTNLIYESNRIIDDFYLSNNKLIITEYHLFDMELRVIDLSSENEVTTLKTGNEYEFIELIKPIEKNETLKILVESQTMPTIEYSYDEVKNKLIQTDKDEFSYWASSGNYKSEVIFAKGKDGIEVPMLVTYDKKMLKDSISAVLFEAYGAYGSLPYSMFDTEDIVLLRDGFILVSVGVRGSGISGPEWYNAGKKEQKQNTFDDFIASVRHIKSKYNLTSSQTYAKGVSAGGLIMGNMVNNYSDEFGGIILDRPFLDVYNSTLDSLSYLTTLEYTEWGNPKSAEVLNYIYSYSPMQNIPDTIHCNIFMRGSYLDYVTPIEQIAISSFRYSTRMKKNKLNLFKTDFNLGHMIPYSYKRIAEEYSFIKYCIDNN